MNEHVDFDQSLGPLKNREPGNILGHLTEEIEIAQHLLHALTLACESIEDMQDRNALVSVIGQVKLKMQSCSDQIKLLRTDCDIS